MAGSHWALALDVASAKVMVWVASFGRDAELTRETHLYFFDRYSRLADYHRRRGHIAKAKSFDVKAEAHRVEPDEGPPYAAAMAMPRPRHFVRTNAIGSDRNNSPDDAA
jgi:hypothetical protein